MVRKVYTAGLGLARQLASRGVIIVRPRTCGDEIAAIDVVVYKAGGVATCRKKETPINNTIKPPPLATWNGRAC